MAKDSCRSTSKLTATFFCSSVSPSRLISARCFGRPKVVSGCYAGDVVLASETELSPSGLSTFSFNFTSTGVTNCTNCSRPSRVLLGKTISWLVVLIASILILLDFPGFSDKRASCGKKIITILWSWWLKFYTGRSFELSSKHKKMPEFPLLLCVESYNKPPQHHRETSSNHSYPY